MLEGGPMLISLLRGVGAVALIVVGIALYLFSIDVAVGWDRGPFPIIGTVFAILGLNFLFWGYWLVRKSDWAPLAGACLTVALGLGSTFVVFGLLVAFFKTERSPTGYFIAIGCLCIPAFYRFRAYLKQTVSN
jgi:hypothetical protein